MTVPSRLRYRTASMAIGSASAVASTPATRRVPAVWSVADAIDVPGSVVAWWWVSQ